MAKFSFSSKFNNERLFNIETEGFEYKSLEELFENDVDPGTGEPLNTVYTVCGIYINKKSLYDPAPVIATEDFYINLPAHLLDVCKEMINDKRAVAEINARHAGIRIYKYHQPRYDRDCYSVEWVDL